MLDQPITYRIVTHSFLAKLAALKLRSSQVAIVLGKTIHLYNTSREEFLNNPKWLNHELCHIQQFKQHGFFTFGNRLSMATIIINMKLKQELQKNQPSFKQAFRFLFAVLKPIPLHQKQTPALYSLFRPIKFPVELRQQFWHQKLYCLF